MLCPSMPAETPFRIVERHCPLHGHIMKIAKKSEITGDTRRASQCSSDCTTLFKLRNWTSRVHIGGYRPSDSAPCLPPNMSVSSTGQHSAYIYSVHDFHVSTTFQTRASRSFQYGYLSSRQPEWSDTQSIRSDIRTQDWRSQGPDRRTPRTMLR